MSTVEDRAGVLGSILNWLRKGYPDGVPPKDYFPLLALLSRRLTETEVDAVVDDLTASGHLLADQATVQEAIERVAQLSPTDEDVAMVAARLAAAGWPLAGASESAGGAVGANGAGDGNDRGAGRPAFLTAIVSWLRKGYPQGVPATDYVPLLALLRRRLTDEETVWVANRIQATGAAPTGVADIGVLITKVTNEMPAEDDVNRVREQLEAAGWPVAVQGGSGRSGDQA